MRNVEKICVSCAIIIAAPLLFYIALKEAVYSRLLIFSIGLFLIIPSLWLKKRVIYGPVNKAEIKKIDDWGRINTTISVLSLEDMSILTKVFNKNAELFVSNSFEYCDYAIYLHADKPTILYPDKNNENSFKVSKHLWELRLNENEGEKVRNILCKYKPSNRNTN